METHSSVLAWRIPGTAEPGGLPSMKSHTQTRLKRLSSSSSSSHKVFVVKIRHTSKISISVSQENKQTTTNSEMAFGVFLLPLQNPGQIINMGPRKVPKLGLERLTVKPIKRTKFIGEFRSYFFTPDSFDLQDLWLH